MTWRAFAITQVRDCPLHVVAVTPRFAHNATPISRFPVTVWLSLPHHGPAIQLAAPGLSEWPSKQPVSSVCAASATTTAAAAAAKWLPTPWLPPIPSHADADAPGISSVTASAIPTTTTTQHASTDEPAICANASSNATPATPAAAAATAISTAASSHYPREEPPIRFSHADAANATPADTTCTSTRTANKQCRHRANRRLWGPATAI